MLKLKNIFVGIVFIVFLSLTTCTQAKNYVSNIGNYSIDIPANYSVSVDSDSKKTLVANDPTGQKMIFIFTSQDDESFFRDINHACKSFEGFIEKSEGVKPWRTDLYAINPNHPYIVSCIKKKLENGIVCDSVQSYTIFHGKGNMIMFMCKQNQEDFQEGRKILLSLRCVKH